MSAPLVERARAKVNLTLRVIGRRPDGYHELESLVAFADIGDTLTLTPGEGMSLDVTGPFANAAGDGPENLVVKAASALRERVPELSAGRFSLTKNLPVAAGLGGGSADAAAALRLLAKANSISLDDPRVVDAARATGADVPVCVKSASCMMRGVGENLTPVRLPAFDAVMVNPCVALATKDVFAALQLPQSDSAQPSVPVHLSDEALIGFLQHGQNDLEAAAISLQPAISDVLAALKALPACRLARMSGSGATCFAIFASSNAAAAGARELSASHPTWWIHAGVLAGA